MNWRFLARMSDLERLVLPFQRSALQPTGTTTFWASDLTFSVEVMGAWSKLSDQGTLLQKLVEIEPDGLLEPKTRKKSHRQLRPVEIEQLVAEYKSGATLDQLAGRFRISPGIASQHLERAGVPRRRRLSLSPAQVEQAIKLYVEGDSLETVGAVVGSSGATIWHVLRKAGVPTRDSHGRARPDSHKNE
jgi:hypothetical protein